MKKKLRLTLAVFIIVFILGASLLRTLGFFKNEIYYIQEFMGGDKATHFLMGAGLLLSTYLIFLDRVKRWATTLFVIVCGLLLIEECLQINSQTRSFSAEDLIMNLVGALAVYLVYLYILYVQKKDS